MKICDVVLNSVWFDPRVRKQIMEYQRNGIGTKLLKSMLDLYPDVYQTQLVTDNTEKTIAFYKSCGFLPYSKIGCEGFIKIKY